MKKPWLLFCLLALALGGTATAQVDARQELKRLGLSDVQMQQVVETVRASMPELEKARAESRIVQAQLARLLLEDNPAKADLEKTVRQGLEWDFKIRMARIDRSLKLRAIVGKDQWAALSSLSQKVLEAERQGKRLSLEKEDDKPVARDLLRLLKDLN